MVGKVGSVPPSGVLEIPIRNAQTPIMLMVAKTLINRFFCLIASGTETTGPRRPRVKVWINRNPIFQYFNP
jgi:hypothetical protein